MEEEKERVILVTNDDGVEAKGLKALIDVVRPFGKVLVVAPAEPQSGMSHAITVKYPLRIKKLKDEEGLTLYSCFGTPVDCIKLALNQLMDRKPDLVVSGINHGSNASTSVIYSGTMAAALEGCINQIPSIGFSLLSLDQDADFRTAEIYAAKIIKKVFGNGLLRNTCLNVNIPYVSNELIAGIKLCRQNKGYWQEEFDKRTDPHGRNYYWLTGEFYNTEPGAQDTDEWALENNYVSVVPNHIDLTCYKTLEEMKDWEF